MPAPNPVKELIKREAEDRIGQSNFQERYELEDYFKRKPILTATRTTFTASVTAAEMEANIVANEDFDLIGMNAADAKAVLAVDGGVNLLTAGAAADQIIVVPAVAVNSIHQSAWTRTEWEPEHELIFDAIVDLTQVAAGTLFQCGLGLTGNLDLTTDDEKMCFQFYTGGATSIVNWTACTSTNNTETVVDTETDTGVAAGAGESVWLRIKTNSNRIPRFYINGVKVHTALAMTAGANLIPYAGIQEVTTTAGKSFDLRYMRLSRKWLAFG